MTEGQGPRPGAGQVPQEHPVHGVHRHRGAARPEPEERRILEDPDEIYKTILKYMKLMYQKAELVHGDLSEYNILMENGEPVIIDVGQAMLVDHANVARVPEAGHRATSTVTSARWTSRSRPTRRVLTSSSTGGQEEMKAVRIPKERVGALIGKDGATKRMLEERMQMTVRSTPRARCSSRTRNVKDPLMPPEGHRHRQGHRPGLLPAAGAPAAGRRRVPGDHGHRRLRRQGPDQLSA